jgi:hypothetical protein
MIKALLIMKAEVLRDYFGVSVSADGRLESLPMLIESYCPDLTYLPQFFLALAGEVEWLDEKQTFHYLAQVCTTASALTRCGLSASCKPSGLLLHRWNQCSAEVNQDQTAWFYIWIRKESLLLAGSLLLAAGRSDD